MAAPWSLMEPAALNGSLSQFVVLDARPKAEWQAGHIPGAVSFSWENFTRTDAEGIPFRTLPPDEMATALAAMGIDEKTPVAIYGDADKSWGGEGWAAWVLGWMGHEGPVKILNGGIQAWSKSALPLSAEAPKAAAKAAYRYTLRPELDIATAEIQRRTTPMQLIDTRSTLEWLRGKIPGAIHIEWTNFFTGNDRHPLSPSSLKELLTDNGVDPSKPVVYYCRGGVRSGYAWMVHRLSGLPDARNYEGGMEAWWKQSTK